LPNGPELSQVDLVAPSTTIGFADGLELNASSDVGHLNLETQEATLTGTVFFETSDKYQANTDKVIMNFYTGNASSPGPVEATGPIGHITAGKMALTQNIHKKTSESGAILSFGNGVKLVYYPSEIRE
jgi:lipopolysaccharide export system protein LptC